MNEAGTQDKKAHMDALREQIERFPHAPGVYLMKDASGTIVYVGKAKNLRNRVKQYVSNSGDPRYHIRLGLLSVVAVDFLVTHTEKEALILENTLIKKHHPRFSSLRVPSRIRFLNHHLRQTYKRFFNAITGFSTRFNQRPALQGDRCLIDLP